MNGEERAAVIDDQKRAARCEDKKRAQFKSISSRESSTIKNKAVCCAAKESEKKGAECRPWKRVCTMEEAG